MNESAIAWAAGIIEGEGSFSKGVGWNGKLRPIIQVSMCDRDIIERLTHVFGGKVYGPYIPKNVNHKPYYRWSITRADDIRRVIAHILPLLGERRTEQALECNVIAAMIASNHQDYCMYGHAYSVENTYLYPGTNGTVRRVCRKCAITRAAASKKRRRENVKTS